MSSSHDHAAKTVSTVIPALRYHDAPTAIDWLCEAFGFTRHLVVPGEDNTITHAQLVFGNGMIMLGSARNDEFGKLVQPPVEPGHVNTQCVHMIVTDVDAHYAQAKAAGAKILSEVEEQPYGGKHYSCRDPEGHLWSFGSYDPWAEV